MGGLLLVMGAPETHPKHQTVGLETQMVDTAFIIRFTRPAIRNPLSVSILHGLTRVIDRIDPSVLTVIFTGTDDVFASGADLREIASVKAKEAREFALRGQALMAKIAALPQATIAAINGYCFGGALDLALSCERRIASPNAEFAHPGAGLGIITGWGGTQRLPRLIGTAFANEMFFSASPVNSQRALSIGLVDSIADDPLSSSIELANSHI